MSIYDVKVFMLIHIPSVIPQRCRCRVIHRIMRTHSTKGSHKKLLAVKSWQPRWHLRSGTGNGRGEPGEEVGKIQRCPLSPIASPVHVKFTNTNFELLVFCAKATHRKK